MNKRAATSGSLYSAAGQRKYLTESERDLFIQAAERCTRAELRTLCLVLAYTGCRISEALSLKASAIQPSGFVAIRSLKKRGLIHVREVPIPPTLLATLNSAHPLQASEQRLWMLSRNRAWQLVKSVMAAAGIPAGLHATPKGLRHAFGIHAIQSGVPINLVQRWLGHARLETTAIYLNAIGAEEMKIAARMWTQ